jgi:hypothetical protein
MNENCEVNLSPFANGDDDSRYEPCGRPARFKVEDGGDGTWMCAAHYDEHVEQISRTGAELIDLEGL